LPAAYTDYRASKSESVSVPLSANNGLSRLAMTSNGQAWAAWPIRKFSSQPITWNSRFEFKSSLEASQIPNTNLIVSQLAQHEFTVKI